MICEGLQWRYWLDKRVSKVSAVTTVLWILDDCQRQCLSLDMFRLSHTQVACLYQLTYIKSHVTSDDYQLPDRSHRAVYRVLFLNWTPVRGQPPTVMAGSAQMLGAQPIAPGNWCFLCDLGQSTVPSPTCSAILHPILRGSHCDCLLAKQDRVPGNRYNLFPTWGQSKQAPLWNPEHPVPVQLGVQVEAVQLPMQGAQCQ